jgi:flagellar biosynthetic protein FliR
VEEILERLLGVDIDLSMRLRIIALGVARMIGLTLPLPFIGGKLVPARIRFGVPLFFALFLHPFLFGTVDGALLPPLGFTLFGLAIKEIFIGFCIGFVIALPFEGFSAAGAFMDTQRGTTFAQVISPSTGGQATLIGQMLNLMFIAIFLSLGGFQITLQAMVRSYEVFPILAEGPLLHPNHPAVDEFILHTMVIFTIAVQFGAPVVASLFLTDATLGIVNRAAPNIQVFFLGMPIKALGGLVVLFVLLAFASEYFAQVMADLVRGLDRLLVYMAAR